MREKDWEILAIGDRVIRDLYEQPNGDPDAEPLQPRHTAKDLFQIVEIRNGTVTLARLCEQKRFIGALRTITEVVELQREGALFDGSQLHPGQGVTALWTWEPPARGEARLTGGWIVNRADGSEERERCPTATTRR